MSLYLDLSEFLAVPMRTGIQRVGGEICQHLPLNSAIPVQLRSGQYVALPPALIQAIGRFFRSTGQAAVDEIRSLCAAQNDSAVRISEEDLVLIPEIFGQQRAEFFRDLPDQQLERCRFIVYDLLPFTHPEYFPPNMPLAMSGYFRIIRRATCCGFISDYTRDAYYGRLKRTAVGNGFVLRLGCDSLGGRRQHLTLNRPLHFTVLGTIEPRKNHELILEAFEPLLGQIKGLRLSFIGKMGWVEKKFAEKVKALAADRDSGFRFHSAPGDNAIRSYIEHSRATIYISSAEGYGLPPVESLWLGTPVIASRDVPSLENLGTSGIHIVEPLNLLNIRRAVLAFIDDEYANQKARETMDLNLPTWKSFTEEVLHWCQQ